jgi:hypothetical protein
VAGRALAAAEVIQDEGNLRLALGEVSQALVQAGDKEGLDRALTAAEAIQSQRYRAEALGGVMKAFVMIGQNERVLRALCLSLDAARRTGYSNVFEVVEQAADWLVTLDNGDTLMKIYQAIEEVDSWWRPSIDGPRG